MGSKDDHHQYGWQIKQNWLYDDGQGLGAIPANYKNLIWCKREILDVKKQQDNQTCLKVRETEVIPLEGQSQSVNIQENNFSKSKRIVSTKQTGSLTKKIQISNLIQTVLKERNEKYLQLSLKRNMMKHTDNLQDRKLWRQFREQTNSDRNFVLIEYERAKHYLTMPLGLKDMSYCYQLVPNFKLQKNKILISKLTKKKNDEQINPKICLQIKEDEGVGPDIPLCSLNEPTDSPISYEKQNPPLSAVLPQNAAPQIDLTINDEQLVLPVKGLKNSYYFCYLNATIQCLFSIPDFNTYFYKKIYNQQENNDINDYYTPTKKAKNYVLIFSEIVKLYFESDSQIVDLFLLKKAVSSLFSPREQHDAQEFLRYLLSEIQDELNPRMQLRSSYEFNNAEEAYQYYLKTQTSIVDKLFAGQLVNTIICLNCKDDGPSFDPFFDLSLSVIEGHQKQTIYDSMDQFFKDEDISNDYYCSVCNQFSRAKKQAYISKTPKFLTIHIKRFKSYLMSRKLLEFVHFPLDNLSLKKYLRGKNGGPTSYNLIAMIVHSGTQDFGHYYAYVRRDSKWFICNDSTSYEVSENQVMKQEAFMLFYQRMDEES